MNFDDALKRYAPQAWFRFKFFKYKHLERGEAEFQLVRHLVEPGTTAVDIGASIGMYAAEMARYAAKVIAFEANPAVAQFTRSVVPRNVELTNVALSAQAGRAVLKFPVNRKGEAVSEAGSIEAANPMYADAKGNVEVEVRCLDDIAVSNCSFVKIDVEGHEEQVLAGAPKLIETQRPVFMIELNEAFGAGVVQRVAEHFAARSYGGYFLSLGALRPVAEFDAQRFQDVSLLSVPRRKFPPGCEFISNFIFIPGEKRARIASRVSFAPSA